MNKEKPEAIETLADFEILVHQGNPRKKPIRLLFSIQLDTATVTRKGAPLRAAIIAKPIRKVRSSAARN